MQIKLEILHSPLQDEKGIADCNLRSIVFKDVYHIFEEHAIHGFWGIYHRTSSDGIKLSLRSEPLFVFGNRGTFNECGHADPTVIYDNGWKMWFDAMNRNGIWDKFNRGM